MNKVKGPSFRWGIIDEIEFWRDEAEIEKFDDEFGDEDEDVEDDDEDYEDDDAGGDSLGGDLKDHERRLILTALEEGHGSRKFAAEKLGISPRTLRYKLARLRDAGVAVPGV